MRPFVVAANWKMNKVPEEATSFMRELTSEWQGREKTEVILFPTDLCWKEVSTGVRDLPIQWGLQNAHPEDSGAYTGEISMAMAARIGAGVALIGHSERRTLFAEKDDFVNKKMLAAAAKSLKPMLCLGETLEQRESGMTNQVIGEQLKQALKDYSFAKEFYIAYEPVWAIGTGQVATPEMAQEAHAFLRSALKEIAGDEVAGRTAVLYGGSVKPENAAELSKQEDIDGFLVGGASLEASSFLKIIDAV